MPETRIYIPEAQKEIEDFYKTCFAAMGWEYEPKGEHYDIADIAGEYMGTGLFWLLYDGNALAGTVAVRQIGEESERIAELKRLYVHPAYQGKGYGDVLFRAALDYAKTGGFRVMRIDTRLDRNASRHLIGKYGFREIGRYNDNVMAELFFELDLKDYLP